MNQGAGDSSSAWRGGLVTRASSVPRAKLAAQWLVMGFWDSIAASGLLPAVSRGLLETFTIPLVVCIYVVIYYVLPHGSIPVSRVLPAAVIAGSLTVVAKFVHILTLPLFSFREVYGPFTLSVMLLFWAYVAVLILLFGAHLSVQNFWEDVPAKSGPI